jgi:hypothetical protein
MGYRSGLKIIFTLFEIMLALIQIVRYFLNMTTTKRIKLFWKGCQPSDLNDYQFVTIWAEVGSLQEADEILKSFPKYCGFKAIKKGGRIIVESKCDLTSKEGNITNEAGLKRLRKISDNAHLSLNWGEDWKPSNLMSEDYFKNLLIK